jgi:hypothetical protein
MHKPCLGLSHSMNFLRAGSIRIKRARLLLQGRLSPCACRFDCIHDVSNCEPHTDDLIRQVDLEFLLQCHTDLCPRELIKKRGEFAVVE